LAFIEGATCAVSWLVAVGAEVAVGATVAVAAGTDVAVATAAGGRVAVGATGLDTGAWVAVTLTGATVVAAKLQDVRMKIAAKAIPVNL
jgi:hypothetical protein